MRQLFRVLSVFIVLLLVATAAFTDSSAPAPLTLTYPADLPNGLQSTLAGENLDYSGMKVLIATLGPKIPGCDINKSSFMINIVRFPVSNNASVTSHWYVYDASQGLFEQASGGEVGRIYGDPNPYIIVIHLNSKNDYAMAYTFTEDHRTPANLQAVEDALTLYQAVVGKQKNRQKEVPDVWAWGQLSIDTPANVTVTAGIVVTSNSDNSGDPQAAPGTGTQSNVTALEKTPAQFDDEGLYHWDVSVGVPIKSYDQVQNVLPQNGATAQVPASIDKRNLLLVGDYYVKPVDLESTKFVWVPYIVGGLSFASKPLHAGMAGLGIGPATAGIYVGAMIITDNLPNNRTARHIKLAFGMNFPVRAIMSKLGVKTQLTSGGK